MTDPSHGEPALTDIQHAFPAWITWRGPSGTCYARHAQHPANSGYQLRAGTPGSLRDLIRDAGSHASDLPVITLGIWPSSRTATAS